MQSPEEYGKVERSHRTDEEEFYRINRFVSIEHCLKLLRRWEKEYNTRRPHMALGGKTPHEYLTEKLRNHISGQALTAPLKSVQKVG